MPLKVSKKESISMSRLRCLLGKLFSSDGCLSSRIDWIILIFLTSRFADMSSSFWPSRFLYRRLGSCRLKTAPRRRSVS